MKASIKLREAGPPLVRAKVPVGVLGLPFISGVTAAARELRLDFATGFRSGASLRLSYHPNDPLNPFSLVIKTGVGALGSPSSGSPLSMAVELGLLGGSCHTFSLLLKPRLGDFSFRKSVSAVVSGTPHAVAVKVAQVSDGHGIGPPIVEFRPDNAIHLGRRFGNFPVDVSAFTAGSGGGIDGLLSGFEVSARSENLIFYHLPLRNRTAVEFKWGLRVPPELRTAFDDPAAGICLTELPCLVMSKISIERLPYDRKAKEKRPAGSADATDSCASVRREVEALQAQSALLRSSGQTSAAGSLLRYFHRWRGRGNRVTGSCLRAGL
ncbi:unnamed protein product, partial [Musa banksii]